MKNTILILLLFCVPLAKAQSITGFTISPTNPTTTDTVYVYADLQFPYSGCPLDFNGFSVSGFTINASTMHCVGMLAAICNTTDTFKINPLPSGVYTFNLTLSSGSGMIPCTPGIVPNDNQSVNFTVSGLPTVADFSGGNLYCLGDSVSDVLVEVTGTPDWIIDYTLDGNPQFVNGSSSPISLGNAPGVYELTQITDANGTSAASGTQTITIEDCSSLDELNNPDKKIIKVLDLLGRETTIQTNTVLIYVFADGTSQRVFIRE